MLRILAIIAPSTAASRSASSKTRNGALPPSSIETRSTCSADCSISFWPDLGRAGEAQLAKAEVLEQRLRDSARAGARDDVQDAAGQPGLVEDLRHGERAQRRRARGLQDHRATGRDRRADLARRHRRGEVPGRDQVGGPDRLLHDEHAALRRWSRPGSGRRCGPPPRRTSGRTRPRSLISASDSATGLPISSVIRSARSSMRSIISS